MYVFPLPRFTDGLVLHERDLYQLARLSFEAFRWGAVAASHYGFFSPPADLGIPSWNSLSHSGSGWTVEPLFLIAPSGYPFVTTKPSPVPGSGTRLFATLRVPEDSQQHADRGYAIEYDWDPKEPPSGPWVVELGEVDPTKTKHAFRLKPPAISLRGTPGLDAAATDLTETLRQFRSVLLRRGRTRPLDAALVLDRIDRLLNLPPDARADEYISGGRLLLEAVKGFFHRLAWEEGPAEEKQMYSNLTGRYLEDWLIADCHQGRAGIVPDRLNELVCAPVPKAATDQEDFVKTLAQLFSRTGTMSQRLSMRELENTAGFPRDFHLEFQLHCYLVPPGSQAILVYLTRADNNTFCFEGRPNLEPTMRLFPRRPHQVPDGHPACYRLVVSGPYLYLAAQRSTVQRVCPEELPA